MTGSDKFASIFPKKSTIPAEHALKGPINQSEYLINGELRQWDGPMRDVFSPLHLQTDDGYAQPIIGRYPLLTERESL